MCFLLCVVSFSLNPYIFIILFFPNMLIYATSVFVMLCYFELRESFLKKNNLMRYTIDYTDLQKEVEGKVI